MNINPLWLSGGWNNSWNWHHHQHHHGYWNDGIWFPPTVIVQEQPIVYLQPAAPIVAGRKWLGVTYEGYEGGGAYVTGIYDGSPAQAAGIEVGDVIVNIDGVGVDGGNLPAVVQESDGDVVIELLSGRNGDFLQAPVNLVVN